MQKGKLEKIPKEKFIKTYLENSVKDTARLLGICVGAVAKLANRYDVHKNNIMR